MPERTLNLPLSGKEIVAAINDKIATALHRNCQLHRDRAYEYFKASITIQIELKDVNGLTALNTTPELEAGTRPEDQFLDKAEVEFNLDPQPPNDVRTETGQDVPVEVRSRGGKSKVEAVRYARKRGDSVEV